VTALLRINDVVAGYGAIVALRGASLRVESGDVVGLLGANGAGKTTMVRVITGLVHARSGSVELDGVRIDRLRAEAVARRGVSVVPEGRRVFPGMTVEDNLLVGGWRHRGDAAGTRHELERVYELFPRLAERPTQLAGSLSGGEQQMLATGRAVMSRPRLLILDEPSLGLAPKAVETVYERLRQIHREGTSILLIEQNLRLARSICTTAYLMARGVATGPYAPDELEAEAARHYLGEQSAKGRSG